MLCIYDVNVGGVGGPGEVVCVDVCVHVNRSGWGSGCWGGERERDRGPQSAGSHAVARCAGGTAPVD